MPNIKVIVKNQFIIDNTPGYAELGLPISDHKEYSFKTAHQKPAQTYELVEVSQETYEAIVKEIWK